MLDTLVRSEGQVLSKDDLRERVWPESFVSDDAVWRAMAELRRTFTTAGCDDPVETLRKRGYRLIAPCHAIEPQRASNSLAWPLVAAALGLSLVAVAWLVMRLVGAPTTPIRATPSDLTSAEEYRARPGLENNSRSIRLFEAALERNPGDPRTLAGLAWARCLRFGNYLREPQLLEQALAAANRALAIAPDLVEAHHARGCARSLLDGPPAGLPDYQRALQLRPSFVPARHNAATALLWSERYSDAVAEFVELIRVRPRSTLALQNTGLALMYAGDLGRARQFIRRSLELDPMGGRAVHALVRIELADGNVAAAGSLVSSVLIAEATDVHLINAVGELALWRGDYERARKAFERSRGLSNTFSNAEASIRLAHVLTIGGSHEEAEEVIAASLARYSGDSEFVPDAGLLHAAFAAVRGDTPAALKTLEEGPLGPVNWRWVAVDPVFSTLLSEPRFHAAVRSSIAALGTEREFIREILGAPGNAHVDPPFEVDPIVLAWK